MAKLAPVPDLTTLSHPEKDVLIVSLHAQVKALLVKGVRVEFLQDAHAGSQSPATQASVHANAYNDDCLSLDLPPCP